MLSVQPKGDNLEQLLLDIAANLEGNLHFITLLKEDRIDEAGDASDS